MSHTVTVTVFAYIHTVAVCHKLGGYADFVLADGFCISHPISVLSFCYSP